MTYYYPYPSDLARTIKERRQAGETIEEWVRPGIDIKKVISSTQGPIIELAGPTFDGHYYLDGVRLLSRPLITNIQAGSIFPWDKKKKRELDAHIDMLLDGTHLELPDNSVGMFIAAHLSVIDDTGVDFANLTKAEEAELSQRMDIADNAVRQIAEGAKPVPALIDTSLRLGIAAEAWRCLAPGGLYLADATPTDKMALERLGFDTLAYINKEKKGDEPYYYLVLQKPTAAKKA